MLALEFVPTLLRPLATPLRIVFVSFANVLINGAKRGSPQGNEPVILMLDRVLSATADAVALFALLALQSRRLRERAVDTRNMPILCQF